MNTEGVFVSSMTAEFCEDSQTSADSSMTKHTSISPTYHGKQSEN